MDARNRSGQGEEDISGLLGPVHPVAGVAEARQDVGHVVEALIDGRGEQPHVRRRFLQRRNAFRRDHHAQRGDVIGAARPRKRVG